MADAGPAPPGDRSIFQVAPGTFVVHTGDRRDVGFIAGPPSDRWAFWNGQVFHQVDEPSEVLSGAAARTSASHTLTAPMPATVIKVLVEPGARVTAGETVVLLEAMKMELPVRALTDGTVKTLHCQAGDLVGANQELVVFE
jgi:3-methylcrotonyl-CoA carboxylase alpha subunit